MKLLQKLQNKSNLIMGILNATPDSFSDGGLYLDPHRALDHVHQMIESGADIIDIGGESSRPGAKPILASEELLRIMPIIKLIKSKTNVLLSIDTYKAEVMEKVLDMGVDLINDIKALSDGNALEVVSGYSDAMICLMHMQGEPQSMQNNPIYTKSVETTVKDFLTERISQCGQMGIASERIIIDPGFGFGKTFEDNWRLYQEINKLVDMNYPVLIGLSRKSMLKNLVGTDAKFLDEASAFFAKQLLSQGARIIRTHNVTVTKKYLEGH
jgi:dihydropteroate synthase